MRNLVIALALLLAACAGTTTVQQVTTACNGVKAALNSLAAYRMAGRLSDDQIATVNTYGPLAVAACTGDPANVTAGALDQIDAAMFELLAVQRSAK